MTSLISYFHIFFDKHLLCTISLLQSNLIISNSGNSKKFHYIWGCKIFRVKTQRKVVGTYHVWEVLLYFIEMSVSLVFTLGGSIFYRGWCQATERTWPTSRTEPQPTAWPWFSLHYPSSTCTFQTRSFMKFCTIGGLYQNRFHFKAIH